jgi:hypothetical protein
MSNKRREDFNGHPDLSGELYWLGKHCDALPGDTQVYEIRLKLSNDDSVEQMAVVKAVEGNKSVVGFVTAPSLDTLVHLVAAKLTNGSMKWREDKPYEARQ